MQTKAFLPPPSGFTLKKPERLCSKKAFEFLFSNGKTVFVHPIKIIYAQQKSDDTGLVQVAFGASKRNFKRANKRNRVKRLLREVYRKNKLQPQEGENLYIMLMYISNEIDNYNIIEASLIKALNKITVKLEKNF